MMRSARRDHFEILRDALNVMKEPVIQNRVIGYANLPYIYWKKIKKKLLEKGCITVTNENKYVLTPIGWERLRRIDEFYEWWNTNEPV